MNTTQLGIGYTDDFSLLTPDGPPDISFPVIGDSILETNPIIIWSAAANAYVPVTLGNAPNIQPWTPNQRVIVIEQDFTVDFTWFKAVRLNTPYNPAWALSWQGVFPDGFASNNLASAILVEQGALKHAGGSIYTTRLKFVTVPPVRNEIEQFCYNYPGLASGSGGNPASTGRNRTRFDVPSRLQFDYYIFDDWNVLGTPLFPNGNRLNATNGMFPPGLILPEQYYYANASTDILLNNFISESDGVLSDNPATMPSALDWKNFLSLNAEIVAQASTLRRWMGNIWERRTRFVRVI